MTPSAEELERKADGYRRQECNHLDPIVIKHCKACVNEALSDLTWKAGMAKRLADALRIAIRRKDGRLFCGHNPPNIPHCQTCKTNELLSEWSSRQGKGEGMGNERETR